MGRLGGVADDTSNPDELDESNEGFIIRQNMWCNKTVVPMTGPLYSTISTNSFPIPSDIEISISMTRNKSSVLITQNAPGKNDTFRIILDYLEIVIPRIIIKAEIQHKIENILTTKPIELIYNRHWAMGTTKILGLIV